MNWLKLEQFGRRYLEGLGQLPDRVNLDRARLL